MKKIGFVTPPDVAAGFSLAGVRHVAATSLEARDGVRALTGDESMGLVAIDERLVTSDLHRELEQIDRTRSVLMVVMPAPAEGRTSGEEYALRLIRRAIGYQVRVSL